MDTRYLDLKVLLDVKEWQKLQDSLALATGYAIITVDYKGIPITTPSSYRSFCTYLRSLPELEQLCHKCDSRGGLEAARINKPYTYLCHFGIVDIAIPILVNDKYIGALMAGQVRLPPDRAISNLEKLLISESKSVLNNPEIKQKYEEIPIASFERINVVADFLYDLCQYVVKEAVNKNIFIDMCEHIDTHDFPDNTGLQHESVRESINQAKKAMNEAFISSLVKSPYESPTQLQNQTLRPAFEYIHEHKNEYVTLKKMAKLCHISESHFSRSFLKEVGDGFSNYLARLKVDWSKILLEQTDLSITQISEDLGFGSSGYYTKVFKKLEKISPTAYRKYFLEERMLFPSQSE